MYGNTKPFLSITSAHLLSGLFAFIYVGSIYAFKNARLRFSKRKVNLPEGQARLKLQNERWRDDPDVIKARLLAVTSATLICCLIVFVVMKNSNRDDEFHNLTTDAWLHLGFTWSNALALLITPLLFSGPLYVQFLEKTLPFQKDWNFEDDVLFRFFSIVGLRNYFVAPITEEIVFRACVLTVYHLADASRTKMIFLSPLVFGAAHIHHAFETYHRYGRTATAAKRALISTTIQFTYTSIFGFYCCYLFLRSGSLLPPIAAHMFCNIMGIPQPNYEISLMPHRKLSISAAYLFGIIGFVFMLKPWSYTDGSLYWQRN
ncbi:CAAX protease self-immunity-domain-containing protein [Suillus fuscotomentosus]|uniref:intramembrane prenyl-peptidase Rce1 n=1 Tax=Suillus fuscotomentosus TaxID=1912939 RepID=A0AAD4E747_9AGAM|nr:CAAX protease self-immunity-domain-containing protein [Suillus fuscotomentosus]KAG1899674.1 CAAX protease self-immunity-domain-containing protein [Suillus fuscotomentosus]